MQAELAEGQCSAEIEIRFMELVYDASVLIWRYNILSAKKDERLYSFSLGFLTFKTNTISSTMEVYQHLSSRN